MTSQGRIQWPLAWTDSGYIQISCAIKQGKYFCPECKGRFVARQGKKVRWHFAHYPGQHCSGEGSRHSIAKHWIAKLLLAPFHLGLPCGNCGRLTRPQRFEAGDVRVEQELQGYRVDVVARINGKQIPIEVIDTNPPDEGKEKALPLLKIEIKDLPDEAIFDGERIAGRLYNQLAHYLRVALFEDYVFFHTWSTRCWKCKKESRVALLCGALWPDKIPTEMRRYGNFERRDSRAAGGLYIANVCPFCKSIRGDWYLKEEFMDKEDVETYLVPCPLPAVGLQV